MVRFRLLLLSSLLALWSCGPQTKSDMEMTHERKLGGGTPASLASEDFPELLDVGSWNLAWFGNAYEGPSDEALQQANVASVLEQTKLDVVGLVEVVDKNAFNQLLERLPEYDGFLANDSRVQNNQGAYSEREQKVALIYKRRFSVTHAELILTDFARDFGGRPPLKVELSFEENSAPRKLIVIVVHLKAMANADGWQRRTNASAALENYLDANLLRRWVLVVGDWNDDLDVSTYRRSVSPFANFVDDAHYRFTTESMTAANVPTTVGFAATIDHHLVTSSLSARYVADSAVALHPEAVIPDYGKTTSDHYPVVTRYDLR